jgi:hypothetical protein
MMSDREREDLALYQREIMTLHRQLAEAVAETHAARTQYQAALAGNAKVVHALDRGVQLIEVLIAFLPAGEPLHPGLASAKHAFDEALKDLRR